MELVKVCEICGKHFPPKANHQKYCSKECVRENAKRLYCYESQKKVWINKCECCGKEFVANVWNTKWCYEGDCQEQKNEYTRHKARLNSHNLRAGDNLTNENWTIEDWERCLIDFEHECVNCGSKEELTLDHWIPVSKGGLLVSENVIPLCECCNNSKSNASPLDWLIGQPGGLIRYVKAIEIIGRRKIKYHNKQISFLEIIDSD